MYKELKYLDELIETSKKETVIIYKHSATCGLSGMAKKQVDNFVLNFPQAIVYQVTVQIERELSNQIAEFFEVEHQSPQILIIKDGKSVVDFSHNLVKMDLIEKNFLRIKSK